MVLLILPLLPYSLFWKEETKWSSKNIFQIHAFVQNPPGFLCHWEQSPFDGWPVRPHMIWHPASSGTLPLTTLTPWCPLHTSYMGFVLIPEYANLPHSICSCLEHSSTRYLPDFLRFLTSLLKYHLITKDYCLGLGFPKSRTWNKGLDAGSFGEDWSQGRESGRKERKLNQGYISELVDVVSSQSSVWLGPSVDHEECSP